MLLKVVLIWEKIMVGKPTGRREQMDEITTFDVDGLLNDLDHLWDVYAKYYAECNGSEYLRGVMNSVRILKDCVCNNRHVKKWHQGTLFEELYRKERS